MSKSQTSDFRSSAGVVMIRVPAGSFAMGSPASEDGHRVWEQQREVTFVNDFLALLAFLWVKAEAPAMKVDRSAVTLATAEPAGGVLDPLDL